jgi:hypothetical protein
LSLRAVGRNGDQPLLLVGGDRAPRLTAALERNDRQDRIFALPLGLQAVADESTLVGRLEIVPSRGSDHLSFERDGVPSLLITDGVDPLLWGQPEDDWALVDAHKVARVARLVFRAVFDLANAPEPIATTASTSRR